MRLKASLAQDSSGVGGLTMEERRPLPAPHNIDEYVKILVVAENPCKYREGLPSRAEIWVGIQILHYPSFNRMIRD